MKTGILLVHILWLGTWLMGGVPTVRDLDIRPVRDPIGFCWQAEEMGRLMAYLAGPLPLGGEALPPGPLVAGIAPHDDYLYAGYVTAGLIARVEASEVLVIGVTHSGVRKSLGDPRGVVILDSHDRWQGPYGRVEISPLRQRFKKDLKADSWLESNEAHRLEHSIEALVPMLQHHHRSLVLTPVMVTAMSASRMRDLTTEMAEVVRRYLVETGKKPGRDFCVLISADGNHYGPDFNNLEFGAGREGHRKALAYDRQVLNDLTQGPLSAEKVIRLGQALGGDDLSGRGKVLWCGRYSIPFGLSLALKLAGPVRSLQPRLLAYSDTFTQGVIPFRGGDLGITAPFSLEHWVSFFSVAVY